MNIENYPWHFAIISADGNVCGKAAFYAVSAQFNAVEAIREAGLDTGSPPKEETEYRAHFPVLSLLGYKVGRVDCHPDACPAIFAALDAHPKFESGDVTIAV
jgi:hypothetical protein